MRFPANSVEIATMQHAVKPDDTRLTEASFRALTARTLYHEPPPASAPGIRLSPAPGPSDFDLNPELEAELALTGLRPAAVLVPVVARPELTVLLTLRTDHLPSHAGQISFPGGKIEDADPSPVETALRETEEEIGLSRNVVEPLGYLDAYRTGTGYRIIPVVALVRPDFTLHLNTAEVTDAFEVPLSFLMDEANHQRHARQWRGRERHFYAMPFEERYIWGATAGMIRNLHQRLFRP